MSRGPGSLQREILEVLAGAAMSWISPPEVLRRELHALAAIDKNPTTASTSS